MWARASSTPSWWWRRHVQPRDDMRQVVMRFWYSTRRRYCIVRHDVCILQEQCEGALRRTGFSLFLQFFGRVSRNGTTLEEAT